MRYKEPTTEQLELWIIDPDDLEPCELPKVGRRTAAGGARDRGAEADAR